MDLVSAAQIAAAVGTLVLAALTFAYVLFTRGMVKELRETRLAQERPYVIVDADYGDLPAINVVVRNIGKGPAKDITFGFSTALVESGGRDLSELPYFKDGIDFLAPGSEIKAFWDMGHTLLPLLEEKGLHEGITATTRYRAYTGEPYETNWVINPLIYKGLPSIRRYSVSDMAKAVKRISDDLHRAMRFGELRVATKTERREENQRLRAQIEAEQEAQRSGDS